MEGPDEGEVHSGWSIDGDWGIDGMNEGQNLSDSVCMGTEKDKVGGVGSDYGEP